MNIGPVERALREARHRKLDIQIFTEANPAILNTIEHNRTGYFSYTDQGLDDRYGLTVLSRFPLESTRPVQFGSAPYPILEMSRSLSGREIRCWAIHPATPVSP